MAYLTNYLSGNRSPSGSRRSYGSAYTYPKAYQPYQVPRRGVRGIESASPFGGQDLASALLQQRQVSKSVAPDTSFVSSYNYDPILAKIQALGSETVANATTDAAQLRKNALIQSGQTQVGQSLGFDQSTLDAASQNPESEYAQLQREFAQRQKDLEEAMSAQNLLYSGEYVNQLSQLNQGRASAEGDIGAKLREMLSGIDTGLLSAQETARQNELDAAQAAALARQYAEGITPGGPSGDLGDFVYGSTLPSGYTADQIYKAALDNAPRGQVPAHIMNQGQVIMQNGHPGVMIKYWDNSTGVPQGNTIWVPLPVGAPTTPVDTTPPGSGNPIVDAAIAAQPAPTTPLEYILGGGKNNPAYF